jgi:hypothetical protein
LITSGRLRTAEISVPITNPPWTAIVSHAAVVGATWNSATIGAVAAVAENHIVMPRNMASDNQARWKAGERDTASEPTRTPPRPSRNVCRPQI